MKNFSIHIPRWEELPNIDLYLDQVVTVIEEDFRGTAGSVKNAISDFNETVLVLNGNANVLFPILTSKTIYGRCALCSISGYSLVLYFL